MKKFVMIDYQTLPNSDFHQEKEMLAQNGIECVLCTCRTDEDVVNAAYDAEVIGDNYYHITEALLSKLPRLKAVIRYGIGYDVVDVDACTRHGVMLCNLPRFCVVDVATHAFAFTLDLCRKLSVFNQHVRQGEWNVGYGYPSHRLGAMTIGLVGFGNIARQFRNYLAPFHPTVLAYDPFLPQQAFDAEKVQGVTLEYLLKHSDIISLHIPSIPSTYHFINSERISQMKPGMMLINTSRGPLVDTTALVEGMKNGQILAAALDVIEGEPIRNKDHVMFTNENLIVTPHTSYDSVESSDDQHTQVAEIAVKYFAGERPESVVNKQVFENQ